VRQVWLGIATVVREQACDVLVHRAFIHMGGTMVHSYRFSNGEVLRDVIVDHCP